MSMRRVVVVALCALAACGAPRAPDTAPRGDDVRVPIPDVAAPARPAPRRAPPPRETAWTRDRDVRPCLGLVPSDDAAVTASLAAGARLALDAARAQGGPDLTLAVAPHESRWDAAASAAVRLAFDDGAVAVIAPPERRRAHVIAQMGTRAGIPVISTSPARSVTSTGSGWVVGVVPQRDGVGDALPDAPPVDTAARADVVAAYRAAYGHDPDGWAVAGWDAARAALARIVHQLSR